MGTDVAYGQFAKHFGHNQDGSSFRNPAFGAFEFKPFGSVDDITSYIEQDRYGTEAAPGICFGFSI
jgi:hypothetical protein